MDSTQQRIQRLEEDLKAIKSVLDRNKNIVRQMLMKTGSFKLLMGFAGVSFLVICFSYYAAIRAYGGLTNIPPAFHWIFGTLIVAAFAVASALKLATFLRQAEEMKAEPRSTLVTLIGKSPVVVHVLYPIVALMIFVSIFLIAHGAAPYCVAVWAIGLGIVWNAIGAAFSLMEYVVFGWWQMATGVLSMIFTSIHPLIWTGVIFGAGFTLVTIYLAIAEKRTARKSGGAAGPAAE